MQVYRKTWVQIDLDAIKANVSNFKQHLYPHQELMAVVKADGYGHGAVQVAQAALQAGADWLGVSLLEEALEIRQAGIINTPILVLSYVGPEHVSVAQQADISLMVNDLEHFREVCSGAVSDQPALSFHVKLDTGMGRLGMNDEREFEQLITSYVRMKQEKLGQNVNWEGIYTHLATADESDETYLNGQIAVMQDYLDRLSKYELDIPYRHMSNSAGILRRLDRPFTNVVRLGISMYGLSPSHYMKGKLPFDLRPAFGLHSRLGSVKKMYPGQGVSYGTTYVVDQEMWVGAIPIGYGDGLPRNLSHRAQVLIDGKRMDIIGRICMDQTMVKLDRPYPRGEKVTFIGKQLDAEIPADEMAELLQTINYEIPCMISKRVPRIYSSCKS